MKERTLKEIEEEIEHYRALGGIGEVMDLVDEHGSTIDKMFHAIVDGNLEQIYELETLGIDITQNLFVKLAIKYEQLLVLRHQVHKGANIDTAIEYAEDYDIGIIWQWAKSWKKLHFTPESNNQPKETIWNEKN
jgi:hypothetical protein